MRICMVLISVNAVLRFLKRSTCVGGRTHLVVVAIYRFDAEPQSRGWLGVKPVDSDNCQVRSAPTQFDLFSTSSLLTRLPSREECSSGETGEWGRGAASRLYLVRPVRR